METDNQRFNATVQPNSAFLAELKEKLPEFFTRDNSFDLEKFQAALKEKNVSELSEGYQLNFIGKDYARRQAGEMPTTVIVPDEDQNNGAGKNSQNLFFTGDNLEVLRHLQNNYQNKIDVIYIDPPYNTGSDGFVYPDNFEYSDDKLKEMFGMNDDQVTRLKSIQGKASHSAWLTFMYPRLALAKRLLANDGVIFISIDDNEITNLCNLMDELYGEVNLMGRVSVVNNPRGRSQDKYIATSSEYLLIYSKTILPTGAISVNKNSNDINNDYPLSDKNGQYRLIELRNTHRDFGLFNRPNLYYPFFVSKEGNISLQKDSLHSIEILPIWNDGFKGCWTWGLDKSQNNLNLLFGKKIDGTWKIYRKSYAKGSKKQLKSIWNNKDFFTDKGQARVNKLFNTKAKLFSAPKSEKYIKQILLMCGNKDSTVLDFFAGSSTTADAVMQLNAEDGGHRKFIMVQLPEKTYHTNSDGSEVPTKGGKAAYEAGFRSIDEISRERIRRAAAKIKADNELTLPADFDGSFKHYRVVKPNRIALERIEEFKPDTDELVLDTVTAFSSDALGVAGNASGEQTVLATWLAKDGYAFDADIQKIDLAGYQGNLIENNRLYLIRENWGSKCTEKLLNLLGTHALNLQAVVIFGYSFNLNDLRELENGLKQLDGNVSLIKRY
ncbi:site-specific DNA-methyltransferase [Limosilactobacillus mucosae]|uniref:site-specific DNA-methyltransferase n=1 Tax=Limosilactobacillus mucosae TaxID=97478 RepID=UPI00088F923B|nr:site-specific DNA-methyltransferase [Limosilactobacillus mucosae]SDN01036.1 adenine-specific DNA-methyltransferase [Limosilactobacillus mucosae]SEK44746.1 adenine-specific DNA-methyltransferase [Limosilactobacillus mucosae]SFJ91032.1 adenine-specific DNA-methyltransferase [Limosilactobacillus mucosae]